MFGFLPGSKVKAGGGALNAGLREYQQLALSWPLVIIYFFQVDQQFALQWVQANVSPTVLYHSSIAQSYSRSPNLVEVPRRLPSGVNLLVLALLFNMWLQMVEGRTLHFSELR